MAQCVLAKLTNEYTRTLLAVRKAMQAVGADSGIMQLCGTKKLASTGGKLLRDYSMLRYILLSLIIYQNTQLLLWDVAAKQRQGGYVTFLCAPWNTASWLLLYTQLLCA